MIALSSRIRPAWGLACALLCAPLAAHAGKKPPAAPPPPAEVIQRLSAAGAASTTAGETLADLCDSVGNRLAGSAALDKAIAWGQARMKAFGLDKVRAEPAMVPVWIRGEERAELLSPVSRPLSLLGLGGSVGTPPGGITADVVVVASFEELGKLGEATAAVKGRIVVFDEPWAGYGETVRYRGGAATAAAKLGAVATLVRSIGPISYDTPHTGAMGYADGVNKIPAAAITIEDAAQLHRMTARGVVPRVHLEMGAHTAPDAPSANVVGEIVGREHPEEVVLLGGHLDSWDVGQGAQDDGAGVAEVLEAVRLVAALGLHPKRTIRAVLFTNEENGLGGGKAYRKTHEAELARHVAVLETDSGSGAAQGFTIEKHEKGPPPSWGAPPHPAREARDKALVEAELPRLRALAPLLAPLGVGNITAGHSGADLIPTVAEGVLGIGYEHDASHYFDVHHTRADTFDKVDVKVLQKNATALAAMAWLLAEVY